MKKSILKTKDGSVTLHIPEWNEHYHSIHGAVTEALYVFMDKGLFYTAETSKMKEIKILEMGFGTGLNALLTFLKSEEKQLKVAYTSIEAFPLPIEEIEKMNYPELLSVSPETFLKLHQLSWEEKHDISRSFSLVKRNQFFSEVQDRERFNLIYFDAFGIRVQPELWTEEIFANMYNALEAGGILVTYAANGNARRAMKSIGFRVELLDGPPGKRHMMRAFKE